MELLRMYIFLLLMSVYTLLCYCLFIKKRRFARHGLCYIGLWTGFFKNRSYAYLSEWGIEDIGKYKIIFSK